LLRVQHGAAFDAQIIPLDNKGNLLEQCAAVADILLREGCDRVVILWDEEPGEDPLCWHNEKERVLESMRGARVNPGFFTTTASFRAFCPGPLIQSGQDHPKIRIGLRIQKGQ
jgi:hypothetical protein